MICENCQEAAYQTTVQKLSLDEAKALHNLCKGKSHCDCQHRPTVRTDNGYLAQRRS